MKANDATAYRAHDHSPTQLRVGPRHVKPITDDLIVTVEHTTTGGGRSILLSRNQAADFHAWLGRWLEEGWDGVRWEHGPTSADVIAHYRDIAVRHRVDLDHARVDAARQVDAALALIPAHLRTVDLEHVAAEQSLHWARLQAAHDALEQFRLACVSLVFDLAAAKTASADTIRKALHRFLDRHNHPTPKLPTVAPDAPIYDTEQMTPPGTDRLAAA